MPDFNGGSEMPDPSVEPIVLAEPYTPPIDRGELVAAHLGPIMLKAIDRAHVRFIPTNYLRYRAVQQITKYTLLFHDHNADTVYIDAMNEHWPGTFPKYDEVGGIANEAARDSYWLGSAAYKHLRHHGVPRAERAAKIADSTAMLITANLPTHENRRIKTHILKSRAGSQVFLGSLRVRQRHLDSIEGERVSFNQTARQDLLDLSHAQKKSGCPALPIKHETAGSSLVNEYWRRYVNKVFTPFGKKRPKPTT